MKKAILLLTALMCACTAPKEQPGTPSIQDLNCYARAVQGELLTDVERMDPDTAREQYQADKARGTLEPGCWAGPRPRCNEECNAP